MSATPTFPFINCKEKSFPLLKSSNFVFDITDGNIQNVR